MNNSVTETLLGAAVLIVAAAFFAFASQSTDFGGGGGERYTLAASFSSAEGVDVGTDVRMAGVNIGAVRGLELNTDTYLARVTFGIREDIAIPDDSEAKIASEGLLGGSFVEITPGGSPTMLEPGDEITFTQGAVSLINLMLRFVTSSGEEEAAAQ